jgi:hypothetical protein
MVDEICPLPTLLDCLSQAPFGPGATICQLSSELQPAFIVSSDKAVRRWASSSARSAGRRTFPGEVFSMSTAAAPTTPGRRSRRWWYLLATGVVVLAIVVGTLVVLRFHPFGIGGGGAAARPHTTERSTGTDKAAPDKAAPDKPGATDKSPGAARITHEKPTATPGS